MIRHLTIRCQDSFFETVRKRLQFIRQMCNYCWGYLLSHEVQEQPKSSFSMDFRITTRHLRAVGALLLKWILRIKCLRLHLNLQLWRQIGIGFPDLIITQRWCLNQMVGVIIYGHTDPVVYRLQHYQLFWFGKAFRALFPLVLTSCFIFNEQTPDSFETCAFRDLLSSFRVLSPSTDIERVAWFLLLWHAVQRLRLLHHSSSESGLHGGHAGGVAIAAFTISTASGKWHVALRNCRWSLCPGRRFS